MGLRMPLYPANVSLRRARPCVRRALVAGALGVALAASAANGPRLQWERGALTGSTRGQPLGEVLRELAAATGTVVRGGTDLTQAVPANLDRVPLVEALRVLLHGQNYMLLERGRGRALHVVILGSSGYPPATLGASDRLAGVAAGAPAAPDDDDVAARIEAIERLADADDANSQARLRAALADPNEAVRAVAREALDARASRSGSAPGRRR